MLKKNTFCLYLSFIILSFCSCDDIIEKDLSHKNVDVLTPSNGITSSTYTQLFMWEDLKGASAYHLQIVKPDFLTIKEFVTDTIVHATSFSYTLKPGKYQWRIKGTNGSSSTSYQVYDLTIDSTNDLTNQRVQLYTPANNSSSNSLTQTFSWLNISSATNYLFQAFTVTNSPIAGSLQSISSPTNTATFTFPAEGIYKWRVYAQNATSSTVYSENTLTIDTQVPDRPIVISPINDTTITGNPVALKWNSVTGATGYKVQVSTDSAFVSGTNATVTTNIYNYSTLPGTKYYWHVKAIDDAGNESAYTSTYYFRN